MNKRIAIPAVALVLGLGGFGGWWLAEHRAPTSELALYGNVDLRQVDLAFNDSGRIAGVLVEEGDTVNEGDVLARLDTSRLAPQVANAEAKVEAQKAAVERLRNGSRPEEIAAARANLEAAQAEALAARQQYDRKVVLGDRSIVSQQEVDTSKAAMDTADAKVAAARKSLELVIAGPREEDITQSEAELRAAEAQLMVLREQLADADLKAPVDSVVRTRLMEPGEIASPQQPVFSLAIIDPKWVRTYVAEPDLAKVRPGMAAGVTVDGLPGVTFDGRIGFISPVAEFTPHTVQTEELRTSLVYEVRVNVADPENRLRLGMPATVRLSEDGGASTNTAEQ